MIALKTLFILTLPTIFLIYSFVLTPPQIVNIIVEELLTLAFVFILFLIYSVMKKMLSKKVIYQLIPKNSHVPVKQTLLIFFALQLLDFYFEDGFIGMISLWWMYWLFGIGVYFLMDIINFYKNLKAYK